MAGQGGGRLKACAWTKGQLKHVEHGIAPPMKAAITIPLGDPHAGLAVYVAQSAFAERRAPEAELMRPARITAGALAEA